MGEELLQIVRNIQRLAALQRTGLLDSPREEAFDRFTRIAARILRAPIALISLVDEHRQFFKSAVGLVEPWKSKRETPLSYSFCKHVVARGESLIVGDARAMPLVRDNPAVSELQTIAYAGMPLKTREGHVLGTLCVVDSQPRQWQPEELDALRDLAACLEDEIDLRRVVGETGAALRKAEAKLRDVTPPGNA